MFGAVYQSVDVRLWLHQELKLVTSVDLTVTAVLVLEVNSAKLYTYAIKGHTFDHSGVPCMHALAC